jgi:hypothetical protein
MDLRRRVTGFSLVSLLVAACHREQPPPKIHAPSRVAEAPVAPAAPLAPSETPAPPKPDPCPPPPPGSVSDDDAPVFSGVGPKVELVPWLEARGVARASAIAWYARRYSDPIGHAEAVFAYLSCNAVTVGDAGEEALACVSSETYSWMRNHALVLVVRGKRIDAVLDVGIGVRALDWPDARHLDLMLAFEPGGRAAILRERAPEGALVVPAPSACREHHVLVEACEAAIANNSEPPERCPFIVVDSRSGKRRLLSWSEVSGTSLGEGRATMHGCASARAELERAVSEMSRTPNDPAASDARGALTFIKRACGAIGRYVWKRDRFVRSP